MDDSDCYMQGLKTFIKNASSDVLVHETLEDCIGCSLFKPGWNDQWLLKKTYKLYTNTTTGAYEKLILFVLDFDEVDPNVIYEDVCMDCDNQRIFEKIRNHPRFVKTETETETKTKTEKTIDYGSVIRFLTGNGYFSILQELLQSDDYRNRSRQIV